VLRTALYNLLFLQDIADDSHEELRCQPGGDKFISCDSLDGDAAHLHVMQEPTNAHREACDVGELRKERNEDVVLVYDAFLRAQGRPIFEVWPPNKLSMWPIQGRLLGKNILEGFQDDECLCSEPMYGKGAHGKEKEWSTKVCRNIIQLGKTECESLVCRRTRIDFCCEHVHNEPRWHRFYTWTIHEFLVTVLFELGLEEIPFCDKDGNHSGKVGRLDDMLPMGELGARTRNVMGFAYSNELVDEEPDRVLIQRPQAFQQLTDVWYILPR